MIVELQIDADAFCKSFREQMRKALACELTEGVFDLNEGDAVAGTPYIITGYTVGKTTLRRAKNAVSVCVHTGASNVVTHRQVKRPQLVQELVVHISWEHDIRAANAAKAPSIPFTLPLVFELGMETCGNQRLLCFHYMGLDSGVEQAIAQKLGQKIPSRCVWLPVDRVISKYMPKDVALINAHLAMTESRKCLAVRMEFWEEKWGAATGDMPRSVPEWDLFYNGQIIDRLQRGDVRDGWSIFIDQRALTHFVREMIRENTSGPGITITRQPVAAWYPWYPLEAFEANRVRVGFDVEKKDACWCFTEDLDVEAAIIADVVISVPAEDTLRIDVYVDISLDGWDATCCVLTAAIFWPALGLGQAVKGKIKPGMYFLGFLPFAALIGAIIALNEETSKSKPPAGFVEDPDNKLHSYSIEKLDLPNDPNFGKMTLRGTRPVQDPVTLKASGLYLYGGLETFSPPQPELATLDLEPFCWGKAGRCSRRIGASSRFRLEPVNPQHWALLQVCKVEVIEDPMNVFKVEVIRELHGLADVRVTVDFWGMKEDYWKSPYPCRLKVKTTGGVRILTLPPLPALTEEQFKALYLGAQLEYVNECYLPRHRLFEELEWPIEVLIEQPGLYHWQVRAVGLEPGEKVQLLDSRGAIVGRFTVNRAGTLLVNAMGVLERREGEQDTGHDAGHAAAPIFTLRRLSGPLPSAPPPMQTLMHQHTPHPRFDHIDHIDHIDPVRHGHNGRLGDFSTRPICGPDASGSWEEMIKIRRTEWADLVSEHMHATREVMIRQTLLEERGRIALEDEPLALAFASEEGRRLVVVTEGEVHSYDLSDASAPRAAESWPAEGVRGAVEFGGRLLLWGRGGIWTAGERQPERTPFSRCDDTAVRGAAVAGGRLWVLRHGELRVYGPDLCEQTRFQLRAEQVARAGDTIALLESEGVRFFEAERGPGREAAVYPVCGVQSIQTPALPLGDAVYVRSAEGGFLLTPDGERTAEWEGGPWFAGAVRLGRLMAFADGDGVRLLEATTSAQSE